MPTLAQAKAVYSNHYKEAEKFLSQYASDLHKNYAITSFYQKMFVQYPAIQWFGIATFASAVVGENIKYTGKNQQDLLKSMGLSMPNPDIEGAEKASASLAALNQGLCAGNQHIFKNIFSVFHTYMELGINGLKMLMNYEEKPGAGSSVTRDVIDAFTDLEFLMSNPLSIQEITKYNMNKENFGMSDTMSQKLFSISLNLTKHEQYIASPIYEQKGSGLDQTFGGQLSSAITDPMISSGLNTLHLSGPTIRGKYVPFTAEYGDITSFENRLNYFEKSLGKEYFAALQSRGGLAQLVQDSKSLVASYPIQYHLDPVHYDYQENMLAKVLATPIDIEIGSNNAALQQALLNLDIGNMLGNLQSLTGGQTIPNYSSNLDAFKNMPAPSYDMNSLFNNLKTFQNPPIKGISFDQGQNALSNELFTDSLQGYQDILI